MSQIMGNCSYGTEYSVISQKQIYLIHTIAKT